MSTMQTKPKDVRDFFGSNGRKPNGDDGAAPQPDDRAADVQSFFNGGGGGEQQQQQTADDGKIVVPIPQMPGATPRQHQVLEAAATMDLPPGTPMIEEPPERFPQLAGGALLRGAGDVFQTGATAAKFAQREFDIESDLDGDGDDAGVVGKVLDTMYMGNTAVHDFTERAAPRRQYDHWSPPGIIQAVGETAPRFVLQDAPAAAAGTAAAGPAGGAAAIMLSAGISEGAGRYEEAYQKFKQAGFDDTFAHRGAAAEAKVQGIVSGMTTALPGMVYVSRTPVGRALARRLNNRLMQSAAGIGAAATAEGIQEAGEQFIADALLATAEREDLNTLRWIIEQDREYWDLLLFEGTIGAIVGGSVKSVIESLDTRGVGLHNMPDPENMTQRQFELLDAMGYDVDELVDAMSGAMSQDIEFRATQEPLDVPDPSPAVQQQQDALADAERLQRMREGGMEFEPVQPPAEQVQSPQEQTLDERTTEQRRAAEEADTSETAEVQDGRERAGQAPKVDHAERPRRVTRAAAERGLDRELDGRATALETVEHLMSVVPQEDPTEQYTLDRFAIHPDMLSDLSPGERLRIQSRVAVSEDADSIRHIVGDALYDAAVEELLGGVKGRRNVAARDVLENAPMHDPQTVLDAWVYQNWAEFDPEHRKAQKVKLNPQGLEPGDTFTMFGEEFEVVEDDNGEIGVWTEQFGDVALPVHMLDEVRADAGSFVDVRSLTAEDIAAREQRKEEELEQWLRDSGAMKRPVERSEPVETEQPTDPSETEAEPDALTRMADAMEEAGHDLLNRSLKGPGRHRGGSIFGTQLAGISLIAAARATRAGVKSVKAIRELVQQVAAEYGMKLDSRETTRAATEARKIVIAGDDAKDTAIADMMTKAGYQAELIGSIKAQIARSSGAGRKRIEPATIKETAALNAVLKAQARAARIADKAAREEVRQTARETVAELREQLPPGDRDRFLSAIANATSKQELTERIAAVREEIEHRDAIRRLQRVLKSIKFRQRGKGQRLRAEYEKIVKPIVSGIDLHSMTDKTRERLLKLADFLAESTESRIPEHRLGEIRERVRRLSRASVREMTAEQVNEIATMIEHAKHLSELKDSLIARQQGRKIAEVVDSLEDGVKRIRPKKLKTAETDERDPDSWLLRGVSLLDQVTGEEFMHQLAGGDRESLFYKTMSYDLYLTHSEALAVQNEAARLLADLGRHYFGVKHQDHQLAMMALMGKLNEKLEVPLRDRGTVSITLGELASFYAHASDPETAPLLEDSGVAPDRRVFRRHHIDTAAALELLPQNVKDFVDELKSFISSDQMRGKLKETHYALTGVELPTHDGYWSRRRSSEQRQKRMSSNLKELESDVLEGLYILQERLPAKSPIELRNVALDFIDYVTKASNYSYMGQAIRNAELVAGNPVAREAINDHYGVPARKELESHVRNMIGATGRSANLLDAAVTQLTRNFATAKLALNTVSAAKQYLGLLNAFADNVLSNSSLSKALAAGAAVRKEVRGRMMENSPEAWQRYNGHYLSTELAGLEEVNAAKKAKLTMQVIQDKSFILQREADRQTLAIMYRAAELDVKRDNPDLEEGTPEFDALVRELFEYAVGRAQASNNPSFNASAEIWVKEIPALRPIVLFQRELNRSYNVIRSRVTDWRADPTPENAAKAFGAFFLIVIAGGLAEHGMDELRRWFYRGGAKRRDERSITSRLMEVVSQQAGRFYFAGNAARLLRQSLEYGPYGSDVRSPLLDPLADVGAALYHTKQLFAGEEDMVERGPEYGRPKWKNDLERAVDNAVSAASSWTGLPMWAPYLQLKGLYKFTDSQQRSIANAHAERARLKEKVDDNTASFDEWSRWKDLDDAIKEIQRSARLRFERQISEESFDRDVEKLLESLERE